MLHFLVLTLCAATALLPTTFAVSPGHNHPQRPVIKTGPYSTGRSPVASPPRDPKRYCYVKPSCTKGGDDAPNILEAFKRCNNGGTVVMDKTYTLGSPLDLTFLKHVDLALTGELYIKPDVEYWATHSFKYPSFQNQTVFWRFGGEDINIYGDLTNDKSTMDGLGATYWRALAKDRTVGSFERFW